MLFEINRAGSDLPNVARAVFNHRVTTIRARQTTLNRLVCIDALCGSLCQTGRNHQGRYNHQQKYSLHGIPPRILALRRCEISLGFDCASDSDVEPTRAFGFRPENLEHPGETTRCYWFKV